MGENAAEELWAEGGRERHAASQSAAAATPFQQRKRRSAIKCSLTELFDRKTPKLGFLQHWESNLRKRPYVRKRPLPPVLVLKFRCPEIGEFYLHPLPTTPAWWRIPAAVCSAVCSVPNSSPWDQPVCLSHAHLPFLPARTGLCCRRRQQAAVRPGPASSESWTGTASQLLARSSRRVGASNSFITAWNWLVVETCDSVDDPV